MTLWTVNRVRIWPIWCGPMKSRHVSHVLAYISLGLIKAQLCSLLLRTKHAVFHSLILSHSQYPLDLWKVKSFLFLLLPFVSIWSVFLFFCRCVLQICCCMLLHLLSCVQFFLHDVLFFDFGLIFWLFDVFLLIWLVFYFCVWAIVVFFLKLKRWQICVGLFLCDLIWNGLDL